MNTSCVVEMKTSSSPAESFAGMLGLGGRLAECPELEVLSKRQDIFAEFRSAMVRRLENRAGLVREIQEATPVSQHHPARLLLYMTRRCNARCIMCHGVKNGNFTLTEADKEDVSFELFEEHMRGFLPYAERCDLYGLGEVLLMRPTVLKMLSALQEHHLLTRLVTNGALLTPQVVEELAARNLSRIIISVDAVEPRLYEQIRSGLKWAVLDRNLRYVFSQETFPDLEINMVVMRRNVQEMSRLLDYLHHIHGNSSRVTCSFYLLNIMKKDEFFRREVFYPEDAGFLQAAFAQVKDLGQRYGYQVNTPGLDKLNESELVFRAGTEVVGRKKEKSESEAARNVTVCSRPWDTYFLLPQGRGKVCCYNPVPVDQIRNRNCAGLQDLRRAVNHSPEYWNYSPCRFCNERPASDFSKTMPPLELNFPPVHGSEGKVVFPILHGAWSAGRSAGEKWLVAQRTEAQFSDLEFRLPSAEPGILQVEYLDEGFEEAGLYMVENGAWKELGRIGCGNSGDVRSGSFAVFPGGKRDMYVIIETKGAAVKFSRMAVVQKA